MAEKTYIGFALFLGLVLGSIAGKILFNAPGYGAIAGGVLGIAIGYWLDRRTADA